jgi:hypothetical protein
MRVVIPFTLKIFNIMHVSKIPAITDRVSFTHVREDNLLPGSGGRIVNKGATEYYN